MRYSFHAASPVVRESILEYGLDSRRAAFSHVRLDPDNNYFTPAPNTALAVGMVKDCGWTDFGCDLWRVDVAGLRLLPDPDPFLAYVRLWDPGAIWAGARSAFTAEAIPPERLSLIRTVPPAAVAGPLVFRALRVLLADDYNVTPPWWVAVPAVGDTNRFEFLASGPGVRRIIDRMFHYAAPQLPERRALGLKLTGAKPLPFERALPLVEADSGAFRSRLHGLRHWWRVLCNARELAYYVEEADPLVVELFALLHDSRRVHDEDDAGHGERGAQLARELRGQAFELTDEQMERLEYACARHTDGDRSDDPTIGVCWDADRLDLPRVGIRVEADYLSTDAARALVPSENPELTTALGIDS